MANRAVAPCSSLNLIQAPTRKPPPRKPPPKATGIERPIQQELRRRTVKVRVFPHVESLLRLASAILVEIDDEWTYSTKRYLPEAEVDMAR